MPMVMLYQLTGELETSKSNNAASAKIKKGGEIMNESLRKGYEEIFTSKIRKSKINRQSCEKGLG